MPKKATPQVVDKVSKGKGYIKNTNFPVNTAHNDKNGPFYLEERRKRVADRYLEGMTQWEIARLENVDQATIQNDLSVVHRMWREQAIQSIEQHKNKELAWVQKLENEAREEWKKSVDRIEETETTTTKETDTSVETTIRRVTTKKLADTRYMDQMRWCSEMRCKILGLIKDDKKIITNVLNLEWENIIGSSGSEEIEAEIAQLEILPAKEDETDTK